MTTRVTPAQLRDLARDVFARCGLTDDDARTAADVVCYADRHGFATHGVNALVAIYAPRLRDGRINPAAEPQLVCETPAVAVLDGDGGLGLVTMTAAIDVAARKARQHGAAAVAVRNSSHFGAAGYYTHRLATAGLIGMAMSNCGEQGVVPPLGGALRMLGTNPLSAAVPASRLAPFVLDMSTTAVAAGRLNAARRDGHQVPVGWLVGHDGGDVTDPAAFYEGSADLAWLGGRLATGGAKGYGLALLVDLLCGPLAGAAHGPRSELLTSHGSPAEDRDIGHLALALDPAAFGDPSAIADRAQELLGVVAACPPAAYATEVTYPGAPEAKRALAADNDGVPLPDAVVAKLRELAAELDVALPEALRDAEAVLP
ncbi:MAG: Ldh family oxidoreductase [Egibacteraceae bacterium]